MISTKYQSLESILLQKGIVTQSDIDFAKDHQRFMHLPLPALLTELNLAQEEDILVSIQEYFKDFVHGSILKVNVSNPESVKDFKFNLSYKIAREREQIVFDVNEEQKIVKIATSNPMNVKSIAQSRFFYEKNGYKPLFYATIQKELFLAQKNIYSEEVRYKDYFYNHIEKDSLEDYMDEILSSIVEHAVTENASDIYIALNRGSIQSYIFFRIYREKKWRYVLETPKLSQLVQYIQQKANMDAGKITGHDDGALSVKILENKYNVNLRANYITTIEGLQMTLRIQANESIDLDQLGFLKEDTDYLRKAINKGKGLIVLVGATGSGKTTTLYGILDEFNPYEKNIITMEDPVEIKKMGVNQVQINSAGGQGFDDTIRACLRQAPDIILLGEIRDSETAERAVEASNTGHLVLTTIHANSVKDIENRLRELNVKNPSAFLNNISAAIYQELIKEGDSLKLKYELLKEDGTIEYRK